MTIQSRFDLAVAMEKENKFEEAERLYLEVIAESPDHPEANYALGTLAFRRQDVGTAMDYVEASIAGFPNCRADFLNNFIILALKAGEQSRAMNYLREIEKLPAQTCYIEMYRLAAEIFYQNRQSFPALKVLAKILVLEPNDEQAQKNFSLCLCNTFEVNPQLIDQELYDLTCRAFKECWRAPAYMSCGALTMIRPPYDFGAQRLDALKTYITDPLAILVFSDAVHSTVGEKIAVHLRSLFLQEVLSSSIKDQYLPFLASLASCFWSTEYLASVPEGERSDVSWLESSVLKEIENGKLPVDRILLLACYGPLNPSLAVIKKMLPDIRPLEATAPMHLLDKIIRSHFVNVQAELQIMSSLPQLTPIHDDVSQAVEGMYMENPYPRWTAASESIVPTNFKTLLQKDIPSLPFEIPEEETLEVLIAGCGTGQQSASLARQLPHAKILAIDLSARSLAYAVRKSRESGLKNISYARADILELHNLGKNFDLICCSGVLHHMADPEAGLSRLGNLLNPNGFMELHLYSEIGRQAIVEARAIIDQNKLQPDRDGIDQIRKIILARPENDSLGQLRWSPDFYSLSGCRDLLFHVQEHRLTTLQINDMLHRTGLEFVGFVLPPPIRNQYQRLFPQDRTMRNLTNWHSFEEQFPDTFKGMYHFWVSNKRHED